MGALFDHVVALGTRWCVPSVTHADTRRVPGGQGDCPGGGRTPRRCKYRVLGDGCPNTRDDAACSSWEHGWRPDRGRSGSWDPATTTAAKDGGEDR